MQLPGSFSPLTRPRLHDHFSRLRGIQVDCPTPAPVSETTLSVESRWHLSVALTQHHRDALRIHVRHQRRHVLRYPRAVPGRIEVPEAAVEQAADAAGWETAQHELGQGLHAFALGRCADSVLVRSEGWIRPGIRETRSNAGMCAAIRRATGEPEQPQQPEQRNARLIPLMSSDALRSGSISSALISATCPCRSANPSSNSAVAKLATSLPAVQTA